MSFFEGKKSLQNVLLYGRIKRHQKQKERWQLKMKISPDFMLKEIAGDYLVVTVGEDMVDLSDSFMLTESGALLWKALSDDVSEEQLVEALLNEYDIDEETAMLDVKEFLADLSARNMLL